MAQMVCRRGSEGIARLALGTKFKRRGIDRSVSVWTAKAVSKRQCGSKTAPVNCLDHISRYIKLRVSRDRPGYRAVVQQIANRSRPVTAGCIAGRKRRI